MIAAILLASLVCSQPDEFFQALNGTAAVLGVPVPSYAVYDSASPTGKCLRITPQVAAFYYSLVSGYMERELLFGDSKGVLVDTNGMSKAEAFAKMRGGMLSLDLGGAVWLNNRSNRVVRGFARFGEGTLTSDLVAHWIADRTGRRSWWSPYGTIVPRRFMNSWSAASIDFPRIDFKEPFEILDIVTRDVLERSWVTWAQLYDWPGTHNAESLPAFWLREFMGWDCDNDERPGSPATRYGVTGNDRNIRESFVNVIETLAPGCYSHFTNETRRLDYRRLVALALALSVDDRRIDAEPWGRIGIESAWGYTNYVSVTLSHLCAAVITNATVGGAEYDPDRGEVKATVAVSEDDVCILTNSLIVVTNYVGPGAIAVARRSELSEFAGGSVGGARFEVHVSLNDFKEWVPDNSRCHFAAAFGWGQTADQAQLAMWHGSSADPGAYDYVVSLPLNDFVCSNVAVNVSRWRGCDNAWSLDPRDLPDEARIPSPLTHDYAAVLPGGGTGYYSHNYPKWLYENESLVGSVDVFSAGNVIATWDVNVDNPKYMASDSSEAWYYHEPTFRLRYADAFGQIWADVAEARRVVMRTFMRKTGAPPGSIEGFDNPAASMAKSFSGSWGGFRPGPMATSPQELIYRDGEFRDDDGSNVVASVCVSFFVLPRSEPTNTVGRALSVVGNCGYLGGFNTTFKNLRPAD